MHTPAYQPYAALDLDKTLINVTMLPYMMDRARRTANETARNVDIYEDRITRELRNLRPFLQGKQPAVFDEALEYGRRLVGKNLFPFVRPLVQQLHDESLAVIIISQSPTEWVAAAAEEIGNIDQCMGSTLVVENGIFTGEVQPLNKQYAIGKLATMGYEGAPRFAAGDSRNDMPLLTAALAHGGRALATCVSGLADDASHGLHREIHRQELPIPIVGQELPFCASDEATLMLCEGPLTPIPDETCGFACGLRDISLAEFLTLAGPDQAAAQRSLLSE